MQIYCISDIHGCLEAFEEALEVVLPHLKENNTKLCLLGDYIHYGHHSYEVIDRIRQLQADYEDKIIVLMGNHEEMVIQKECGIEDMNSPFSSQDEPYLKWLQTLSYYHQEEGNLFVHAGIDEEAGAYWSYCSDKEILLKKYPAQLGKSEGIDFNIIAGHINTSEIAEDECFHDIYYDGMMHYYIDSNVMTSHQLNILLVDTKTQCYYRVNKEGISCIEAFIDS